jgi:hypothetical protein
LLGLVSTICWRIRRTHWRLQQAIEPAHRVLKVVLERASHLIRRQSHQAAGPPATLCKLHISGQSCTALRKHGNRDSTVSGEAREAEARDTTEGKPENLGAVLVRAVPETVHARRVVFMVPNRPNGSFLLRNNISSNRKSGSLAARTAEVLLLCLKSSSH